MQLAELATRSGVPVATIKYYVREGLLPKGDTGDSRRADYGQDHLVRLACIRALIGPGGLSIRRCRTVLATTDAGRTGEALAALTPEVKVDRDLTSELPNSPGLPDLTPGESELLASALALLRLAVPNASADALRPHARAAVWLASEEAALEVTDPLRVLLAAAASDMASAAFRSAARRGQHGRASAPR